MHATDIRTSFVNHEEVVFNSLFTLIDDARSLRDYAATALVNVQVISGCDDCVCGGRGSVVLGTSTFALRA